MHHAAASALPSPHAVATRHRSTSRRTGASDAARVLRFHPESGRGRGAVERFVADVYLRAYGARVPGFAPMLASVVEDGRIVAAAGWRTAGQRLYLERYLDAPVEACIARVGARTAPDRSRIVEVGHLAATRAGEGRRLLVLLALHLASIGFDWMVSTATPAVRSAFERAGVHGMVLGPATLEAAGPDGPAWGSYYAGGPSVIAGELLPNLARTVPRVLR